MISSADLKYRKKSVNFEIFLLKPNWAYLRTLSVIQNGLT